MSELCIIKVGEKYYVEFKDRVYCKGSIITTWFEDNATRIINKESAETIAAVIRENSINAKIEVIPVISRTFSKG